MTAVYGQENLQSIGGGLLEKALRRNLGGNDFFNPLMGNTTRCLHKDKFPRHVLQGLNLRDNQMRGNQL